MHNKSWVPVARNFEAEPQFARFEQRGRQFGVWFDRAASSGHEGRLD
jgi:hypothetical protein